MFGLFGKIIDPPTVLQHIYSLTGIRCKSITKVERIKQNLASDWPGESGQLMASLLDQMQRDQGILWMEEIGVYAPHRHDDGDPLVTLKFEKSVNAESDRVSLDFLSYKGLTPVSIGVNQQREFIHNASGENAPVITPDNIESAIEISRWIIADGINLGKMQAFGIITRKDFNPNSIYTGPRPARRSESPPPMPRNSHRLNCPYCAQLLEIPHIDRKTEVRCPTCHRDFNVKP